MKVVRMDEIAKEVLTNPVSTGREVQRQALLPESKDYQVNIINFGKGCEINSMLTIVNNLIITAGKGVVATEKEERIVTGGDIVLIPAGEKHWHGSGGDSDFSHIVIVEKGRRQNEAIGGLGANRLKKAKNGCQWRVSVNIKPKS